MIIERIKDQFKKVGVELLSDVWIDKNMTYEFLCICGEKGRIRHQTFIKNIKRDNYIPKCFSCRNKKELKLSICGVREIFRQAGVKLISTEYRGNKERYTFKCDCGRECSILYRTVQQKIRKGNNYQLKCFKCRNKRENKYSVEVISNIIKELDAELIISEYKGIEKGFRYICRCGKEVDTSWIVVRRIIKKGVKTLRCKSCRMKEVSNCRKNFLEIKDSFSNAGLEIISKGYKNNNSVLIVRCVCSEIFITNWLNFHQNGYKSLCKKCNDLNRPKGVKHRWYNSELTDKDREGRFKRPTEIKKWYKDVLSRFHFTCIMTGVKGKVSAHHLYSYADTPELRLNIENGVCISRELHEEFHKKYGKGKNTPHQFAEFYKEKTGKNLSDVLQY